MFLTLSKKKNMPFLIFSLKKNIPPWSRPKKHFLHLNSFSDIKVLYQSKIAEALWQDTEKATIKVKF